MKVKSCLNLGSGSEAGLYYYDDKNYSETKHYYVVNEGDEVPMTLYLYDIHNLNTHLSSQRHITNIFSWEPNDPQWWATGFNPEFQCPDPNTLVTIGTVKLDTGMFNALKNAARYYNDVDSQRLIFDDDGHTVWIIWDGE